MENGNIKTSFGMSLITVYNVVAAVLLASLAVAAPLV